MDGKSSGDNVLTLVNAFSFAKTAKSLADCLP
jgi:hypothetical protein